MNLSDYEIDYQNPLGHGEFGIVYRGWSKARNVPVAVKQVPLDSSDKVELEQSGARTQLRLAQNHPGLVPDLYDEGIDGKYYYVVMELIQGTQLDALIREGPMDSRASAEIALRIADFLARAHALGICHADLKPKHVFVLLDNSVRIIDFGITRELGLGDTSKTSEFASRIYASPERLDSGRVSPGLDRWALGVILYEMLTSHHPYPDVVNDSELEIAIRTGAPMAPLPVNCPEGLRIIVRRLLAHNITRRYRDADAIRDALTDFLRGRAARNDDTRADYDIPTMPLERRDEPPTTVARVHHRVDTRLARDAAGLGFLMFLIVAATAESVAWKSAEHLRERIPSLTLVDVDGVRAELQRSYRLTVLDLGVKLRVKDPLAERLALLTRTVLDEENRGETVSVATWTLAHKSITLAKNLVPDDLEVEALRVAIADRTEQYSQGVPSR